MSLRSSAAAPLTAIALGLGLALAGPAAAADAASSPQDRARFVAITRSLEAAPLAPGAREDRAWAMSWLTAAPDVSVNVCGYAIGDMTKGKFAHGGEILLQYTFAMGAFLIAHPQAAHDADAQQLAGVDSALNAYQALQKDDPGASSPTLQALLKTRTEGQLPAYIHKVAPKCARKG